MTAISLTKNPYSIRNCNYCGAPTATDKADDWRYVGRHYETPLITPEQFVNKHGDAGDLCLDWRDKGECTITAILFRIRAGEHNIDGFTGTHGRTPRCVLNDLMGEAFMDDCDLFAAQLYYGSTNDDR